MVPSLISRTVSVDVKHNVYLLIWVRGMVILSLFSRQGEGGRVGRWWREGGGESRGGSGREGRDGGEISRGRGRE